MKYNRNEYPINEPIFPNLENCGLDIEEAVQRDVVTNHGNTSAFTLKRNHLPMITKEWTNKWMYMMFQYATDVDANKRVCQECYPPGTDEQLIRNEDRFTKGQVVIREQFSLQDFNTLHIACAINKLARIRNEVDEGLNRFSKIVSELQHKGIEIR